MSNSLLLFGYHKRPGSERDGNAIEDPVGELWVSVLAGAKTGKLSGIGCFDKAVDT